MFALRYVESSCQEAPSFGTSMWEMIGVEPLFINVTRDAFEILLSDFCSLNPPPPSPFVSKVKPLAFSYEKFWEAYKYL